LGEEAYAAEFTRGMAMSVGDVVAAAQRAQP